MKVKRRVRESEREEVEELPTEINNEIPSRISMHAFEGHMSPSTIRLEGFIKIQAVSILVDSGSTHNFMQLEVAIDLQLTIHAIQPFNVSTGEGEKLICNRIYKVVGMKIQGIEVSVDLFLIPMSSSNVVLGIQWLKKVGDILSNYEKLTMRFKLNGKEVLWQGLS